MPLAVTHVLLTIIAVDLYRDYITANKKLFSLHTILIAGIAGLLPDIDIPIGWGLTLLGVETPQLLQHGGITHTPFFALPFLITGLILWKYGKKKTAVYFYVATFGILFHIFLDFLLGGGAEPGIMLFWPFSEAAYKIHLWAQLGLRDIPAALDAIILIAWLWHEERKHKIKDFV